MNFITSIQNAKTGQGFDRNKVMAFLADLSADQLSEFCQTLLQLDHFYGSHAGYWFTDDTRIVRKHPGRFWKAMPFDPKSPFAALPQA
jgi:hypothetical protein